MKKNMLFTLVVSLSIVAAFPTMVSAANLQDYTVEEGDTLWGISEKLLGNGASYSLIWEANKDLLDSPDHIYPGLVLTVDTDVKLPATKKSASVKTNKKDVFRITADDYQMGEITLGTKYTIEVADYISDYIITAKPEVAEVKDGQIIPTGIGAAYLWVLNDDEKIQTSFSIAVKDPDAKAVWCYDDQQVLEVSDKTIESVYSSDENIATAFFIRNTVFAHGNNVGACVLDITYDDGSTEQVEINVLDEWIHVYTEYAEQAKQIIVERKLNQ